MEPRKAGATVRGAVVVRPAGPDELGEAASLFDAYRQFYGAPSDLAAARAFLSDRMARNESVVLLAFPSDADRAPIGFAQLYRSFSSLDLSAIIILNDLFVTPRWRRLGAARCLVRAAVLYARRNGAGRLELATQQANHAALHLYQSLGWVVDREFTHLSLSLTLAGGTGAAPASDDR
jgi:GNAT superfamily N-acetyltransferase